MPIYTRTCKACQHVWDHLTLSFSGADSEEKDGIPCPKCESTDTAREKDPVQAMKNSSRGFNRYGLYTYD